MINAYKNNASQLFDIPEHLWELNNNESSSEVNGLTSEDITTLKHELDNLESYKNLQKLSEGMVPVISVTDVESFNDFITDITKKGLSLRKANKEVVTKVQVPNKLDNVMDSNKDSIMQVFQTLSEEDGNETKVISDRMDSGFDITINSGSGVQDVDIGERETITDTSEAQG